MSEAPVHLGPNSMILLEAGSVEAGLRVLAFTFNENQPDRMRRYRCVRGLAYNAVNGRHYGDDD